MKAADVAADARRVTVLRAGRIFLWPATFSASEIRVRCSVMFFAPRELNASSMRPTDRAVVDDAVVAAGHAHAVERLPEMLPGRTRT